MLEAEHVPEIDNRKNKAGCVGGIGMLLYFRSLYQSDSLG